MTKTEAESIIESGKRVIRREAEAVAALEAKIDHAFAKAVILIRQCKGRVIVTGMGKSGIIGRKIAGTLTSTGTSAFFLHPAEAIHGDLGLVLKDDVVLCISKSGNTDELTRLIPIFKRLHVPIISITSNSRSALAAKSDVVLELGVKDEACPNNLAPTASTTATLALGDALAVALLEERHFGPRDFARLHPGGTLGRRLSLTLAEVMFTGDKIPVISESALLKDAILEITSKRFGSTCVVNAQGVLCGIITDGDLRRLLSKTQAVWHLTAGEVMSHQPKTVPENDMALTAFQLMETHNIMQVVVINQNNEPVGIVHLHDLLEAGLV